MKYIIALGKFLIFFTVFMSTFALFMYLATKHSLFAIPALFLCVAGPVVTLILLDVKKCPRCGNKCSSTEQGGSQYKQWWCNVCQKHFWTTIFLEEYEKPIEHYRKK